MERTVIGCFATRRDAEIAIEHLVQEHGIERTDIFVRAGGDENTAGTEAAGADVESGHPGVKKHGEPDLHGPIEVSVGCSGATARRVEESFREAGAIRLRSR